MIGSDNFIPCGKTKEVIFVKLFGKKTLALLLALSMVMSVCVFATGTEETPGGENPGGETPVVPETVAVTGKLFPFRLSAMEIYLRQKM